MKLVLANNQTPEFTEFYKSLNHQVIGGLDYKPYDNLLFYFNTQNTPLRVMVGGKDLSGYDGVYVNGYLRTYELAASVAMACSFLKVPFVNHEMSVAPSLSKLTMHVKLAMQNVSVPPTIGGSKKAILAGCASQTAVPYPLILKRADADRGIDNFKVKDFEEVKKLLEQHDESSLWLLQQFIDNDGFYLVSYYGNEPKFCIFRSLEERPDHNELKAHMFKPVGGANASQVNLDEVEPAILEETAKAVKALDRQIGSVDCLYNKNTKTVYILEVNYNPQLVTINTFKEVRVKAFIEFMNSNL